MTSEQLVVKTVGQGDGTPFVLIHGLGGDAQSWGALKAQLPRSQTVHCIELPGHGTSPPLEIESYSELAEMVAATLENLTSESVRLVGHSLGGALALSVSDLRPALVAGLSLVCPGGLGPEINGDAVRGLLSAAQPDDLAKWLRQLFADPSFISDDFVDLVFELRKGAQPRDFQKALADEVSTGNRQRIDLLDLLNHVQCPTRIIWGRQDAILPSHQAKRAPDWIPVHLIDGAGHLPHIEKAREVAAIISDGG